MLSEILQSSTSLEENSAIKPHVSVRLFTVFSHPWHFITKSAGDNSWKTESRYPLQPATLWHYWKDENTIVGVRFGEQTRYGLIDIDRESSYHPANDPEALPKIRHALETIGIYRTLIVESSESGGIHLYIPLPEVVPTYDLARSLSYALTSASFRIAAGTLELFPNVKRYRAETPSNYAAHRLPLQRGSFLLNDDGNAITNDIGYFLDVFDMASDINDINELRNSFVIAKDYAHKHSFTSSGEPKGQRGKAWKLDCERVIELGWTAYHQTNQILGVIAQYGRVFKGLADQALEKFIYQTAIACPGYSQFCRHQNEIEHRCKDWANSAQKAYTPYAGDRTGNAWKEQKERAVNAWNESEAATALDRIKSAIAQLGDQVFKSIRDRLNAIAQIARCSVQTLYKHRNLWSGCNSQKEQSEGNTAIDQKALENDIDSLQCSSDGLLHPKSVYEGVGLKETSLYDRNCASTAPAEPESGLSPDRFGGKPP